jgi:hypothetical protein
MMPVIDEAQKVRVLAAAEQFARVMRVPKDGDTTLAEWRAEQKAAYDALMEALEGGEAIDATDS